MQNIIARGLVYKSYHPLKGTLWEFGHVWKSDPGIIEIGLARKLKYSAQIENSLKVCAKISLKP